MDPILLTNKSFLKRLEGNINMLIHSININYVLPVPGSAT